MCLLTEMNTLIWDPQKTNFTRVCNKTTTITELKLQVSMSVISRIWLQAEYMDEMLVLWPDGNRVQILAKKKTGTTNKQWEQTLQLDSDGLRGCWISYSVLQTRGRKAWCSKPSSGTKLQNSEQRTRFMTAWLRAYLHEVTPTIGQLPDR